MVEQLRKDVDTLVEGLVGESFALDEGPKREAPAELIVLSLLHLVSPT